MRPRISVKITILLAGALALSGCVRSAQSDISSADDSTVRGGELTRAGFDDLDVSADGRVDERELWRQSLRYHQRWDADDDGRVTRDELDVGTFETWDRDDDERLDPQELDLGVRDWLSENDRAWSRWDVDQSGFLDRDEVRQGLARAGLFDSLDADSDGAVTDAEITGAWFRWLDTDGDGSIDELEWRWDERGDRCIGDDPCMPG